MRDREASQSFSVVMFVTPWHNWELRRQRLQKRLREITPKGITVQGRRTHYENGALEGKQTERLLANTARRTLPDPLHRLRAFFMALRFRRD